MPYITITRLATELLHPKPSDAPVMNAHAASAPEKITETKIKKRWKDLSDIVLRSASAALVMVVRSPADRI